MKIAVFRLRGVHSAQRPKMLILRVNITESCMHWGQGKGAELRTSRNLTNLLLREREH